MHEIEGGPNEKHTYDGDESFTRSNSHSKSFVKPQPLSVIPVTGTDMEILGPDYCKKRPVFLPPNQTKLPLNGTLNMQALAANAYPLASGKS